MWFYYSSNHHHKHKLKISVCKKLLKFEFSVLKTASTKYTEHFPCDIYLFILLQRNIWWSQIKPNSPTPFLSSRAASMEPLLDFWSGGCRFVEHELQLHYIVLKKIKTTKIKTNIIVCLALTQIVLYVCYRVHQENVKNKSWAVDWPKIWDLDHLCFL